MLAELVDRIWNPWLLIFFLAIGLIYSCATGFFQFFGVRIWMKETLGSLFQKKERYAAGISPWQALCTALASTIGTGSVAGVATAIWFGGPGAVFWMWISALLGMMTGFAEKTLAVQYRKKDDSGNWMGGPMYYLRDGVGSRFLAAWFAAALIPASLAGGNLVQASSITAALDTSFGISKALSCGLIVLITAVAMLGGLQRIAAISARLVPLMALLYVGGGLAVLCKQAAAIPTAMTQIIGCALSPNAAIGGGLGYGISAALRYGVARGVFTNEAGLGTSAISHAAADTDHPVKQGMWGIVEVFLATIVICTITALVILTSGVYQPTEALHSIATGNIPVEKLGVPLTSAAFSAVLGPIGGRIVSASLVLFALSSILGWSYYGQQGITYLSGAHTAHVVYRIVYLLCIIAGSAGSAQSIWLLVDLSNALLAIPNLTALLCLLPEVRQMAGDWLHAHHNKQRGCA